MEKEVLIAILQMVVLLKVVEKLSGGPGSGDKLMSSVRTC